jgi:hypothetical protein
MLHKKLRKKGVDVVFEDFVDWDFHGTPLEEGFMRAMQSCNTAVTAGRAMPITRATAFSTKRPSRAAFVALAAALVRRPRPRRNTFPSPIGHAPCSHRSATETSHI